MQQSPPILFNRTRLRKRRARVAKTHTQHDFLWHEAATRAEETLSYLTRAFPTMVIFGGQHFTTPATTNHILHAAFNDASNGLTLVADEEKLPLASNSVDAIICLLNLHWVNDLPGALAQMHHALKPDGLFFAILPGGESLRELRHILAQTEAAHHGGAAARVSPFIDVRDAGALLQRAGFALPVADSEILTITYDNLFDLLADIRSCGESNMLQQQAQHFLGKDFFAQAAATYAQQYTNPEGRITATFEFITMSGWKPAANQQQPAPRGSGKISLSQALS